MYLGKDPITQKKSYYYETVQGKKAAEKRLREILNEMDRGCWVEPVKLTLEEYAKDRWLPHVKARKQQSTYDMYEYLSRVHIIPAVGHLELKAITPMMLDALYSSKLSGPRADGQLGHLSPNTVKHIHDVIRIMLNQAVKWGLIARNVTDSVTPPEVPRQKPTAWTPEQAAAFLESVRDDKYFAAYLLAVQAGLRRGEILGLRWQDVDLVNRSVLVRQTLVKTSEGALLKEPKTRDSQDRTALSPMTVDALKARLFAQTEEKRAWEDAVGTGTWDNPHGLVFTQEDGSLLKPDSFTRRFRKHLQQKGLPKIRFHDLRHTAATIMLDTGTDIKVVSNQLRHADISTTSEFYIGPIPQAQREAADKMDKILGLDANGASRNSSPRPRWPIDGQKDVQ